MDYTGTDFIYYVLGVNIIAADTVSKKPIETEWTSLQTNELEEVAYLANKASGKYEKGIAIVCGKIWRGTDKGKWLNGIDLDNEIAIKEFFGPDAEKAAALKAENLIESHEDDPNSLHIYFVTDQPVQSKPLGTIDSVVQPAIEIKSEGNKIMFSYPSLHCSVDSNGNRIIKPWMFNKLEQPPQISKEELEGYIDKICAKYNIDYVKNRTVKQRIKEKNKIPEGERHSTLQPEAVRIWYENYVDYEDGVLSRDEIYQIFSQIAENCEPPHDEEDLERIFEDAFTYVESQRELEPAKVVAAGKQAKKEQAKEKKESAKAAATQKEKEELERIEALSKTIGSFEQWQNGVEMRLALLHKTVLEYLPSAWPSIEFSLSVRHMMFIHNITKPFAGIILGVPSSSKTVAIELSHGLRYIHFSDKFSAKSLVTHISGPSEEELKEKDLLPKLRNRCLLTPELAPLFSEKEENLNENFGIVTRVLDGSGYESDSGTQGHRGYNERMMFTWVGAAVEIPHKVHRLMTTLGPRLYFLRPPKAAKKSIEEYVELVEKNNFEEGILAIRKVLYDYEDWFEACPIALKDELFHSKFKKIPWTDIQEKIIIQKKVEGIIIRLAILLAHLRGVVAIYETKGTVVKGYGYGMNVIEEPTRAMRQLVDLARGHAITNGRNYLIMEDLPIIMNVALSTAPKERVALFSILLETDGRLTAMDMHTLTGMHPGTASRTMTELVAIELADLEYEHIEGSDRKTKVIHLKDEFKWFLSPEFKTYREGIKSIGKKEF